MLRGISEPHPSSEASAQATSAKIGEAGTGALLDTKAGVSIDALNRATTVELEACGDKSILFFLWGRETNYIKFLKGY